MTAVVSAATAVLAEDDTALVEAGKDVIKALSPLSARTKYVSYFDVMLGPDKVIGYIEASIEGVGGEASPRYRYETHTVIHFPTKAQLHVDVVATLRTDFEPVEIELKRTVVDPKGDAKTSMQRAVLSADKVMLSGEVGDQRGSKEVPRPPGTIIYGIETLVQGLDFAKHESFRLDEFDLQEGGARPLKFIATKWQDGTPTLITYNPDESISYQFWFDSAGNLIRWGEASLPALFVRTTKESVEKWKAETLGSKPGGTAKPGPIPGGVSSGSGFLVAQDLVVTNLHVVENATSVRCSTETWHSEATVLTRDQQNDLALLRLATAVPVGTRVFTVSDASLVRQGARVYALGFPMTDVLGEGVRVHEGIVSSLTGFQGSSSEFQAQMGINPGDSGGPLINTGGQVIGIVATKLSLRYAAKIDSVPEGVAFVIKSDLLRPLIGAARRSQDVAFEPAQADAIALEQLVERFGSSVVRVTAQQP